MVKAAAITSLMLLASQYGFDPHDGDFMIPNVPGTEAVGTTPGETQRISLADVVTEQDAAYDTRQVGLNELGFNVGFDSESTLWVKIRQNKRHAAYTLKTLDKGADKVFSSGKVHFTHSNGIVSAYPDGQPSAGTTFSVTAMVDRLYDTARRVQFFPVEYAVLYEKGHDMPASVCLLRRDGSGRIMVTFKTLQEMKSIRWFVAINGVMHGMKLEGGHIVFYAKRTGSSGFTSAPSVRFLLEESRAVQNL